MGHFDPTIDANTIKVSNDWSILNVYPGYGFRIAFWNGAANVHGLKYSKPYSCRCTNQYFMNFRSV